MSITPRSSTAWLARAQCRKMESTDFDIPPHTEGDNRFEAIDRAWKYAAELCRDCPVMIECARDAVEQHDVNIIRAGVPLNDRGAKPSLRPGATLRMLADGVPYPLAVALTTPTRGQYRTEASS